jgi:hypothetical protein
MKILEDDDIHVGMSVVVGFGRKGKEHPFTTVPSRTFNCGRELPDVFTNSGAHDRAPIC